MKRKPICDCCDSVIASGSARLDRSVHRDADDRELPERLDQLDDRSQADEVLAFVAGSIRSHFGINGLGENDAARLQRRHHE